MNQVDERGTNNEEGQPGGQGQPEHEEAGGLELCAFAPPVCVIDSNDWVQVNFDSGAAAAVIPSAWCAPSGKPSGRQHRAANGQILDDEGMGEIKGFDENYREARFRARSAAVTKPLASASKMLNDKLGYLDEE